MSVVQMKLAGCRLEVKEQEEVEILYPAWTPYIPTTSSLLVSITDMMVQADLIHNV